MADHVGREPATPQGGTSADTIASLVDKLTAALADARSVLVIGPATMSALLQAAASCPDLARTRMFHVRPPLDLFAVLGQVSGGCEQSDTRLEQGFEALTAPAAGYDRVALLVEDAHLLPQTTLHYIELVMSSGPKLQVVLAGQDGLTGTLALPGFAMLRRRFTVHLNTPKADPRPVGVPAAAKPSGPASSAAYARWAVRGRAVGYGVAAAALAVAGLAALVVAAPDRPKAVVTAAQDAGIPPVAERAAAVPASLATTAPSPASPAAAIPFDAGPSEAGPAQASLPQAGPSTASLFSVSLMAALDARVGQVKPVAGERPVPGSNPQPASVPAASPALAILESPDQAQDTRPATSADPATPLAAESVPDAVGVPDLPVPGVTAASEVPASLPGQPRPETEVAFQSAGVAAVVPDLAPGVPTEPGPAAVADAGVAVPPGSAVPAAPETQHAPAAPAPEVPTVPGSVADAGLAIPPGSAVPAAPETQHAPAAPGAQQAPASVTTAALNEAAPPTVAAAPGQADAPEPAVPPATLGAPASVASRAVVPIPAILPVTPPAGPHIERAARPVRVIPAAQAVAPRPQPRPAATRPERVADVPPVPRQESHRCRDITLRLQLGETASDVDRTFLRNGCQ